MFPQQVQRRVSTEPLSLWSPTGPPCSSVFVSRTPLLRALHTRYYGQFTGPIRTTDTTKPDYYVLPPYHVVLSRVVRLLPSNPRVEVVTGLIRLTMWSDLDSQSQPQPVPPSRAYCWYLYTLLRTTSYGTACTECCSHSRPHALTAASYSRIRSSEISPRLYKRHKPARI